MDTIIARRLFLALHVEIGGFYPGRHYFITNDGYGVSGVHYFDNDGDAVAWFESFELN